MKKNQRAVIYTARAVRPPECIPVPPFVPWWEEMGWSGPALIDVDALLHAEVPGYGAAVAATDYVPGADIQDLPLMNFAREEPFNHSPFDFPYSGGTFTRNDTEKVWPVKILNADKMFHPKPATANETVSLSFSWRRDTAHIRPMCLFRYCLDNTGKRWIGLVLDSAHDDAHSLRMRLNFCYDGVGVLGTQDYVLGLSDYDITLNCHIKFLPDRVRVFNDSNAIICEMLYFDLADKVKVCQGAYLSWFDQTPEVGLYPQGDYLPDARQGLYWLGNVEFKVGA